MIKVSKAFCKSIRIIINSPFSKPFWILLLKYDRQVILTKMGLILIQNLALVKEFLSLVMNNLFNHFRDQREQRNRSIIFWVGFILLFVNWF